MAFDGKGSIIIMTGKKLVLGQKNLAFALSYASETEMFDHLHITISTRHKIALIFQLLCYFKNG